MANDRIIKITLVGDATSAQKALKATGDAATQAEVKVEGFGKSFAKAGVALGVGVAAVGAVVNVMHEAVGAVEDYNTSIDQTEKNLLGLTKSQAETTRILGIARAEADKGRGTYQELAGAMAGLVPIAKASGQSLESLIETAQILAAINPAEGIAGATVALANAASGDLTSVIDRFNLNTAAIKKYRDQGVPNIEAVRKAMADLGYDQKFLDTANTSNAKTIEIAKGKFTELAAIVGKPFFDTFIQGVTAATKAVDGPGGVSFAQRLATELDLILHFFDGRVFEQLGVDVGKTLFLVSDAFNNLLKSLSGGKLNIDGPLKDLYNSVSSAQAEVIAATKKGVTDPLAGQLSGKGPSSPLATTKVEAYGAAVLASYIKGLTSAQTGDFRQFAAQFEEIFKGADGKTDANAFAGATATLAMALDELAKKGEVSNDTMLDLSSQFGLQVPEVYKLVQAYAAMVASQQQATATTQGLKLAQGNLAQVQAQAANAAADAEKVVAAAQATAAQHSQEAADALDDEQRALQGVAAAAGEAARASAARVDALQGDLDRAQSAQAAVSAQRQRDSAIAQAAINGETEAILRQTDGLTEQDRKLAEHYETITGGERRAKDAADERVNGLNKAANKEDLDFLTRIDAARKAGHAKEANALQRQFDARKKQRGSEIEIARAQAAVAGDEYDDKVKQIDKESQGRDELDAKNEKAAAARVAAIQADIKGVQDAAKEEAERYAAQQRGIQAEIDRLNDAAKVQAAKDAAAVLAAQNLKTETALHWSIEQTGATVALGLANQIADARERGAKAAKETYDHTKDTVDLHNANPAAFAPPALAAPIGSAPNAGPDRGIGNTGGAPTTLALPPLIDATKARSRPDGYHYEMDDTLHLWFVADGYSLESYGKQPYRGDDPAPTTPGGNGGSDSLSRGGQSALRESGATAAGAGVGAIHLHINAPGLTDVGNAAQQRALAAQVGDAALRAWTDVQRGGPPQGVV